MNIDDFMDHAALIAIAKQQREEIARLRATLEAVEARLTGNWDHPALEKMGALNTLKEEDVLLFTRATLGDIPPYSDGPTAADCNDILGKKHYQESATFGAPEPLHGKEAYQNSDGKALLALLDDCAAYICGSSNDNPIFRVRATLKASK